MNNADLRGVSRSAAGRSGAQTRVDRPAEMDQLWNRYYKLNRIFLSPVGLWPYGNRKLKPIQAIVSVVILVSSVVTQVIAQMGIEFHMRPPRAVRLNNYLSPFNRRDVRLSWSGRVRVWFMLSYFWLISDGMAEPIIMTTAREITEK